MRLAVAAPTAAQLAADVRAARTDPVELVERALARLDEVDDDLAAFVHVDREAALREARQRARDEPRGPLHGVPVAVKDLFDVAGQPTRAGSLVPPDRAPDVDSAAVARLRAAGAVVLGKTRTHEFAWGLTTWHPEVGGTHNPWDTARVAGGSSGGSAVAVAAGVVPLALGSDTGCSIRLPASWCGLVGHKPTHGLVPLDGVVPLGPSLDVAGALTRDVADARLALEVLSGNALPEPPEVAHLRFARVLPDAAPAVVRDALAAAPARDVDLPGADRLVPLYAVVQGAEAHAWHVQTGRWPQHADRYGSDVRARLERSAQISPDDVAQARHERAELRQRVAALFDDVDLLLLPVAVSGPARTGAPDERPDGRGPLRSAVLPWTVLANLCGLPACAVPVGLDDDGLPAAIQVVGAPGSDAVVLAAAAELAHDVWSE